jgi:hypothetical protein
MCARKLNDKVTRPLRSLTRSHRNLSHAMNLALEFTAGAKTRFMSTMSTRHWKGEAIEMSAWPKYRESLNATEETKIGN